MEDAVKIAEQLHGKIPGEEILDKLPIIGSQIEGQKEDITQLYHHLKLLYLFLTEANQGVGDAISNYLQVETALAALQMNATAWKAIYTDLHNANSKVVVKNRFAIKVNYDQSRITAPAGNIK